MRKQLQTQSFLGGQYSIHFRTLKPLLFLLHHAKCMKFGFSFCSAMATHLLFGPFLTFCSSVTHYCSISAIAVYNERSSQIHGYVAAALSQRLLAQTLLTVSFYFQ
ncbi:hypothetical protein KP509_22G047200 [Ceratopteris richardii]|uniref:Uncharacterized protein n=1 Tax=Ceratopteris richardii TaxID=49495 RepID=A0A8T2S7V6_CERRI|nr:hypothetical protein KP509_22G047200 [Ceratopteris richardii]